ncbi:hypothetical protein ACFWXH_13930 [Mesorhizobium sp. NPDC059054]|uniref:hypothetical protein n=1 Tax=Mesorhizobium sp. NPDC059054 TaxID=3346711 RepID=UPI0036C86F95
MQIVLWALLGLPMWYVSMVRAASFTGDIAAYLTLTGAFTFWLAVILVLVRRKLPDLTTAALTIVLSHALVVLATILRGQVMEPGWILLTFAGLQLLVIAVLIWRSHANRLAGVLFGWFAATYGGVAWILAAMSFTNSWL